MNSLPRDSLLTLSSRRFTAGVSPALGGSLMWFGLRDNQGFDFVRPASARAFADHNARLTSSYPLVPYSNRIGDGRFTFDGAQIVLRRNADFSEHPIHGLGWLSVWNIVNATDDSVTLAIDHDGKGGHDPDWPWSFSAAQTFALDDHGLTMTIGVTNLDTRPMPAGIGLHPFYPKSPAMELRFEAAGVWRGDERMLPRARTAVPPEWDFSRQRHASALAIDNCFAGWTRNAEIIWPERGWGLRLAASEVFGHLVVFTSPGREAIAIEPVSHVNNAVNLAHANDGTGLNALEPGATLEGSFTLTPFALAPVAL